jgi:hypothetical protein
MAGEFTCTIQKFPDISHVMGVAPLNKLYSIMLTVYSCTKQAEARAYHDRLSGFVSPLMNSFLLLAALASFICGPGIGYFDCYYDMDHHMTFTTIFTVGEIVYMYTLVYLISSNRNQFSQEAQPVINRAVNLLYMMVIVGILMQFKNETLGISIAQIGEWIAFYTDFYIRFSLASIMKYKCVLAPKNA